MDKDKYNPLKEADRLLKLFGGSSVVFIEGDPVSRELFEEVFAESGRNQNNINADPTTNPSYYNGNDVMKIIERYNLGFCLGNVVKYVLRSASKNGTVDLKKALWYLQREIQQVESK